MCYGATVRDIEGVQDANVIEDFVAISIKSLERFVFLDGGATKTFSGFMSVQPVAVQYEDTTIETTDVAFTFAGNETQAVSANIWVHPAEFPHGISANFVSNGSIFSHWSACDP